LEVKIGMCGDFNGEILRCGVGEEDLWRLVLAESRISALSDSQGYAKSEGPRASKRHFSQPRGMGKIHRRGTCTNDI
jgi:hypothetical protein